MAALCSERYDDVSYVHDEGLLCVVRGSCLAHCPLIVDFYNTCTFDYNDYESNT